MTQKELESNIQTIIKLYTENQDALHDLYVWVESEGKQRVLLDNFLGTLGLEKNSETRFAAYTRIGDLKEDPLRLYLETNKKTEAEIQKLLEKAYTYVKSYHFDIHKNFIAKIESEKLLSEFYLEIMKWVHEVGKGYSKMFIDWSNHTLNGINTELEERFDNDSDAIMDFLEQNNLFDTGHGWIRADRCYSALIKQSDGSYVSKAYREAFPESTSEVLNSLENFIQRLSKLEDEVYNQKAEYLNYLTSIKVALEETDVHNLVQKWSEVDEAWMSVTSPFQIGHPLEAYEDSYRKSVSMEWDMRLLDSTTLQSTVASDIETMYEGFYDEIWREEFPSSYRYSLENQRRVQLYVSLPVLYYGSELCGLYSAQVVPNDDVVSAKFGKKIFAFPRFVLASQRNRPFMELSSLTIDEKILHSYRRFLFGSDGNYNKIYDIETIGHEYGHTLWLDQDNEVKMNYKTGVYKNIEEFKATAGGLVAYFISWDESLREDIVVTHIMRCVWLLKYREVEDIVPYYAEALIHFQALFDSGIVFVEKGKIHMNLTDETFESLKIEYIKVYSQLIHTYLHKIDAWEFRKNVVEKNSEWFYLPVDKKIKSFVENYYKLYKEVGNEIDTSVSKETYILS